MNTQARQPPKEFSNKLDKVSYVNNLSQISFTTFQTFSEKETNHPTDSGTKIFGLF